MVAVVVVVVPAAGGGGRAFGSQQPYWTRWLPFSSSQDGSKVVPVSSQDGTKALPLLPGDRIQGLEPIVE